MGGPSPLWTGGSELGKKAGQGSQREKASNSVPPGFCLLDACLEFLLRLLLVRESDEEL